MRQIMIVFAIVFLSQSAMAQGAITISRVPSKYPKESFSSDGRATASEQIVTILATASNRRPNTLLTPEEANSIRLLILADGKLEESEFDLLDELAAPQIRAISTTSISRPGNQSINGTTLGQSKEILESVFYGYYSKQWQATDTYAGWAEIIKHGKFSEGAHDRVRKFLGKMAFDAAKSGGDQVPNRPAIALLGQYLGRNEKLSYDDKVYGRRLIYEAFSDVDYYMNDALPNVLYEFLRNPPPRPQ